MRYDFFCLTALILKECLKIMNHPMTNRLSVLPSIYQQIGILYHAIIFSLDLQQSLIKNVVHKFYTYRQKNLIYTGFWIVLTVTSTKQTQLRLNRHSSRKLLRCTPSRTGCITYRCCSSYCLCLPAHSHLLQFNYFFLCNSVIPSPSLLLRSSWLDGPDNNRFAFAFTCSSWERTYVLNTSLF